MKVARILCWFGRHNLKMGVRRYPPAVGREEMRCTRCGHYDLIPLREPRYHKVFGKAKEQEQ